MRTVLKDLVFTSIGPRPVGRSLILFVPLAAILLVTSRDLYRGRTAPAVTSHEVLSINMALNAAFCGVAGRLSSRFSPYEFVASHRDLMGRSFHDVIAADAGSESAYCQTVTAPYALAETSAMWLARAALWLRPGASPDALGDMFGAFRLSMILAFGFGLIRSGAPLGFTAAALAVACEILRSVGIRETGYPFVMTLPLLAAAVYSLAPFDERKTPVVGLAGAGLFMGALAAFGGGLRTILLPTLAAMFAVFLVGALQGRVGRRLTRRSAGIVAVPVAAFGIGYVAYVQLFVEPLHVRADLALADYTYHTFAHPLVLGLAVPESPFTERQHIRWDDMTGVALARQIRPDVDLLGPHYDEALLTFYARLWKRHPQEMAMVYLHKLRWTGSGVFHRVATIGAQFGVPRGPAEWLNRVTSGIALVGFALLTFGVAAQRYVRQQRRDALMVALVSTAGLVALGEAFLTHSLYLGAYYNDLLYFLFVAFFFWAQAGIDRLACAASIAVVPSELTP